MTKPIGEENYQYRQWKKKDMANAVDKSATSNLNKMALAKKHHVPVSTLKDRFTHLCVKKIVETILKYHKTKEHLNIDIQFQHKYFSE